MRTIHNQRGLRAALRDGFLSAWRRPSAGRPLTLLLGLLAALSPLMPQAGAQADGLQVRLLDEEKGLGNLSVTALAQDKTGYLWVATENGLFEYHGSSFWEFSRKDGFSEPAVYSLAVDSRGIVWAGTHNGLYWLENHRFHELRYQGRSLRIGMNSMLAATSSGELIVEQGKEPLSVTRDGQGWTAAPYRQRHPDYKAWEDSNGIGVNSLDQMVVGCNEGLCDGPGRVYGPAQGAPLDFYTAIFRARDGRMWARGRRHIVTWRTGDTAVRDLTSLFPAQGLQTIYRRFTEDASGRILTPTPSGFATWDGAHWVPTATTSKGSLSGTSEIFCDREGAVWIGTRGRGLFQSLGYRHWSNYGPASGLSSPAIDALARDRAGRIWLGTEQSANVLPAGVPGLPGDAPGISPLGRRDDALTVQAFAPTPDGGMWSGALLGQLFHTDAAGRVDHHASVDAYVHDLVLDAEGAPWLATGSGLFSVRCSEAKTCTLERVGAVELGEHSVNSLASDPRGGLWAAGSTGLFHLQHGGVTRVRVAGQRQNFGHLALGAASELWLAGEDGGLLRVKVTDASARVLESHSVPELLSDRIQALSFDARGRLWIGTDHGVNVLERGHVSGLTTEDGLSWNDANAILPDLDGSIWIGTTLGLSHLLHPDAALARSAFRAAIERVHYGDRDIEDGAESTSAQPIAWNAGITTIHFGAPTFRENQALIYHYRLSGFDATPVTTYVPFVRFQRLPPGSYTFRVVAEDPVHHVFSAPAELSFTLAPPWWKSRWMFLIPVALVVGAINLVWHSSHRLLLAQQQKLERMVEIRTREIKEMALRDPLTGIMNRRAILSRLDEEMDYARRHSTALCIALLDLDHFKQINDTHGHLAGDEVLRQAAQRLASCVRVSDAIGRYGGEEFIVIFRSVEEQFGREHCERIRRCLGGEPVLFEGRALQVTCSVGLVWTRKPSEFTPSLLARADHAMYRAKRKGRNRVEYASPEPDVVPALALT